MKFTPVKFRNPARVALVLCLLGACLHGHAEVGDLARLVPPDCPIVAQCRNLGPTWQAIENGPLFSTFRKQRLWQQVQRWDAARRLRWWAEGVSDQSGRPLQKTFDTLAGRQVMMLAWPHDDHLAAVFLLRASSANALQALVPVLDRISRRGGKLETFTHRGVTIRHRIIPPGTNRLRADYYAVVDNVLMMSLHRDRLTGLLDKILARSGKLDPPGNHAVVKRAEAVFKDPTVVGMLYLDGKRLSQSKRVPFISRLAERDTPLSASVGRELVALVGALDHAVLTLRAHHGIELSLSARLHRKLPEGTALRYVLAQPNTPSTLMDYLPERPGALGRWSMDPVALNRAIDAFFGTPYRDRIDMVRGLFAAALGGGDLETDILPRFGPEMLMCLSDDGRAVDDGRLQGLVVPAVDLLVQNRGPAEFTSKVDQLLRRYIGLLALMTTLKNDEDSTRAAFYLDMYRDVPVGYLTIKGRANPLGSVLEPAWCFVDKGFVTSTDRRCIRRIIDRRKTPKPDNVLPPVLEKLDPNVGFVYCHGPSAAAMLRRNIPALARHDVDDDAPDHDEALARSKRKYAERIDSAELLDYLLFTGTKLDDGFRWSLTVRSTKPLRRTE